ncbi:MAG: replication initiator protein [Microviridae sp.]|nr:MAG: replication initiator protein [Microviridae sp.]
MCLYPKLIRNKKYTENKKNGGQLPPVVDERTLYVPIGCQNCIECRKKKAREWQVRLQEDIKETGKWIEKENGTKKWIEWGKPKFITLTFSNESIKELTKTITKENSSSPPEGYNMDNTIATKAIRLFLERWRKKYKKSLRHWLVTEIGHNGTENIHMHGIVWTNEPMEEVEKTWQYGYVWKGKKEKGQIINYVNSQTINYIIKYITKADEKHTTYKSIILTSPGIGGNYTKKTIGDWKKNIYKPEETNETYRTTNGNKIALPIYYRNKIYTEEEREKLWIEKLNKEERYVLGIKIDISEGDKEYKEAIEEARRKNIRLGYGTGKTDHNVELYEKERRKIMQLTRIEAAKKNANALK